MQAATRRLLATPEDVEEFANPPSSYQQLSLLSLLSATDRTSFLQVNLSSLLYFTSSICVAPGVWKEDGLGGCMPCPNGATW